MASICFDESRNLIGSDEAGFMQYAIFIAQLLKNNSFNAIKIFKTKVTRSQRNGKDNAKMK